MSQLVSPALLLGCGFLGLAAMGGSGLLIAQAQEQRKRVQARLSQVAAGRDGVARPPERVQLARAAPRSRPGLPARAAGLFGFEIDRPEQHPAKWWLVLAGTFIAARVMASVVALLMPGAAGLALPVIWVMLSRSVFGWAAGKRRNALLAQFPDALMMIVRSVRAGIPVSEAVRLVGQEAQMPTRGEFQAVAHQIAVGVALEEALKTIAARNGLPEYRFFATALGLQSQTGGPLGETLEGLADVIRKRIALRERGHALTSEARTSGIMLSALPFIAVISMEFLNPSYMGVLFTDPRGHTFIGISLLLLGMGGACMRWIIRKGLS